ncbi:hypothetical protein [Aliikangiella coralliicola]|uniref:Uncharacterized protein n=1 Tax=Aliikangiella coralliicola TaxID=2592383 RepID=A0A545UBQ2_9GAMM|nr:hypothetical protein [Aliikangiella coralliicola]TQV86888.1 hypothetical protein FLL46_13810 [Aliikangiella coralliicola]
MKTWFLLATISATLLSPFSTAEDRLCLENICIGDDVDTLQVEWKKVTVDYKTTRAIKTQLKEMSIDDLYYEYNEKLITDKSALEQLAPYIIQLQKFDQVVLDQLSRVKAICTPLSLTGEVENDSKTKLFVTFRVVADDGERGRLRVVQLEKEFNIYPPHIRPGDRDKYVALVDTLKKMHPEMVMVRDIDARASSNKVAFANSVLGYRFFSDVNNPLIFRLRDLTDLESIEFDEKRSAHCPAAE